MSSFSRALPWHSSVAGRDLDFVSKGPQKLSTGLRRTQRRTEPELGSGKITLQSPNHRQYPKFESSAHDLLLRLCDLSALNSQQSTLLKGCTRSGTSPSLITLLVKAPS